MHDFHSTLERMKRSRPPSPAASHGSIQISKSKLESLIQQEVNNALEKKKNKLDKLLETFQEMDCRIDYEASLQKLEAQIDMVTKKSEAILGYMIQRQKKCPMEYCTDTGFSWVNPVEGTMDITSHNDTNMNPKHLADSAISEFLAKSRGLSEIMEATMKMMEKLRADNAALNAAVADLSAERASLACPPYAVLATCIKKEPVDNVPFVNKMEEPALKVAQEEPLLKVPKEEPLLKVPKEEPLLKVPKEEPLYPGYEQAEVSYPPLPPLPCPVNQYPEAAVYNVPQRVTVKMVLIKKPPCLSVVWTIDEVDPLAPPMESYSVYISTEKVKGSNIFPYWKFVETVDAVPVPMFSMITEYQPGHSVCVTVVGKDVFGRYGPYSHVVIATIPEDK